MTPKQIAALKALRDAYVQLAAAYDDEEQDILQRTMREILDESPLLPGMDLTGAAHELMELIEQHSD